MILMQKQRYFYQKMETNLITFENESLDQTTNPK